MVVLKQCRSLTRNVNQLSLQTKCCFQKLFCPQPLESTCKRQHVRNDPQPHRHEHAERTLCRETCKTCSQFWNSGPKILKQRWSWPKKRAQITLRGLSAKMGLQNHLFRFFASCSLANTNSPYQHHARCLSMLHW